MALLPPPYIGKREDPGDEVALLDWQNNNSAHASRFFVHFLPSPARLRCETFLISRQFNGGREHKATDFFFLLVNL